MLLRALVFSAVFLLGVHCDFYSDLRLFNTDPFNQFFEWHNPRVRSRGDLAASASNSNEQTANRDVEPLAPDYKDPDSSAAEDKPILQPNAEVSTPPSTSISPVLPGGVVDVDASGFGNPFDISGGFGFNRPFGFGDLFAGLNRNQWWKGKNVCIEREESTDDEEDDDDSDDESEDNKNSTSRTSKVIPDLFSTSISLSNCFETPSKYECVTKVNNHGVVKTFTVRYKCCYGFKRTNEGCTKAGDLKPIMETLSDIKADEFKNMITSSGLEEKFKEGNFSIFVPSDDALNEYNEKINEMNNVETGRRRRGAMLSLSSKDLVLSHTIDGFVDLTDLTNDEIIRSENNNSSIRVNIYPTHTNEKLVTVNCARIKKPNILAENGILHETDGVVIPATEDIQTIIRTHPQLTSFSKAVEKSDIPSHIKATGHYTVFAPTDAAFNKLDEVQKQKIINGAGCSGSILKHHFTAHTVCSSAIVGNATTHNVEGEILNLERTVDDDLIFEGKAKIIETDIIASNGVIHLIDELIIPDSGLYIGSVLKNQNFSKFQELIETSGLSDEVNGLLNATVFAPANKAFEAPEVQTFLTEVNNDPEKLKEIVRYHIIQGQLPSGDMNNNVQLETKEAGKKIRINLYSTLPLFTNIVNRATINCARIIGFDEKACGSVIHELNRVLVPPSRNILEVINSDPKYSILRSILKDTEVETILQENNRSITFLAPTDETFAALDDRDRKLLLENKQRANYVLKNHVLTEVLCCAGVGPQSWGFSSFVSTFNNNQVEVGRTGSRVRINRAVVTSCDNLATNGVVHTINKVLIPRQPPVSSIGGGFFLFDL